MAETSGHGEAGDKHARKCQAACDHHVLLILFIFVSRLWRLHLGS